MTRYEGPIFDADNHLYETEDALTRYLPKQFEGFVKYVQVKGRTKIAINNHISESIPNPTFEVVAPPGCIRRLLRGEEHRGQVAPRDGRHARCGPSMPSAPPAPASSCSTRPASMPP